ncbi:MAG: fluoride efflux transporter CrcB [Actinomycetota bacterium]|nr:fluoride efflux transporter CrcB [Actinomycetota bacterium]
MLALAVAASASVGACTRYLLDRAIQGRSRGPFPVGILVVNVLGCFLAGIVAGAARREGVDPAAVLAASTGFCGGLTTWSTWAWDTVALAAEDRLALALANVLGSLAAGIAATSLGLILASG